LESWTSFKTLAASCLRSLIDTRGGSFAIMAPLVSMVDCTSKDIKEQAIG
jgi:hypothetical protein